MSNTKAPKKQHTNLKRALWVALVILAIVLTGLWTFEPELAETERQLEPGGDVTTQVRIPLRPANAETQVPQTESGTNANIPSSPESTSGTKVEPTPVIKKVTEDSVVRPSFITDLSRLIVKSYHPKGSDSAAAGYSTLLDAKVINVHYGVEMTGLSWSGDDLAVGRRSVMRYALRPTMISALYALYKERFMNAVTTEINTAKRSFDGTERLLTQEERDAFYTVAATQLRATAGVIKSCAKVDSAMNDIGVWLESERETLAANQRFQSALHDYQVSKEMKSTQSVTDAAERKMKAEGTAYEEAIRSREEHKTTLADMIRKFKWTKAQDDQTNLYIASWVFRRSKDLSNPKEVMMTIQDKLLDLADAMDAQKNL